MALLNVKANENTLLSSITNLGIFRIVESAGRFDKPDVLVFPAAFVYWFEDAPVQKTPRPIMERKFHVLVYNRNLRDEKQAANDVYDQVEAVYDDLLGKEIDQGLESLNCTGIRLVSYKAGVISYLLEFSAQICIGRTVGL